MSLGQLKSVSDEDLRQAIRDLRAALDLSQEGLARRISKSCAAVQKYERSKPPAGKALFPFLALAKKAGRQDLCDIFQRGLLRGLIPLEATGVDLYDAGLKLFDGGFDRPMRVHRSELDDTELTRLLGWLLHMRRFPEERVWIIWRLIDSDLRSLMPIEELQFEIATLAGNILVSSEEAQPSEEPEQAPQKPPRKRGSRNDKTRS